MKHGLHLNQNAKLVIFQVLTILCNHWKNLLWKWKIQANLLWQLIKMDNQGQFLMFFLTPPHYLNKNIFCLQRRKIALKEIVCNNVSIVFNTSFLGNQYPVNQYPVNQYLRFFTQNIPNLRKNHWTWNFM